MDEKINIFWFRRDLRIADNHALYESLKAGPTLPIFIFDTAILEELDQDDARVSFIYQSLQNINEQLKHHQCSIKVYLGKPENIWKQILEEYDVKGVYFNKDYEPYALQRDLAIRSELYKKGINTYAFKDQVVFEENEILKADGNPYTVFTPYKNKWLTTFNEHLLEPFRSQEQLNNLVTFQSNLPSLEDIGFKPSGIAVPDYTFEHLENYEEVRNIPSLGQTSYLSTHLRFGTISVREAVKNARKVNQTLLSELVWREFFMQILFHFPRVCTESFKTKYDNIKWRNNEEEFEKWCTGETGYPMVDAGMRELNSSGLMHNRVRMVTASFLCKHLLIDWRLGEAYFAKKLLDYDLSANNGNWQWVAGSGSDSAPYFRIFNPSEQQKKFDPKLIYIRKWIENYDTLTYPAQMVEHKFARKRCLEVYKLYL